MRRGQKCILGNRAAIANALVQQRDGDVGRHDKAAQSGLSKGAATVEDAIEEVGRSWVS